MYFYFVIDEIIEESEGGGRFASVRRFGDWQNIAGEFKNCAIAQPCRSKKEAQEIADFWNECHRKKGTAPEWAQ